MVYFTQKYKEVLTLDGLPQKLTIKLEDSNRWICYQYRTVCGTNIEFTLIDNYLEIYRVYWCPESTILTTNDKYVSIKNHFETDTPESILLKTHPNTLKNLAMPDFAIDVLETVENNISFEIIHRIVKSFHSHVVSSR